MSGAIHLANYFLDALEHGSAHDAPDRAVKHAAVPLFLAAGTTALGLLSLGYSDLRPIRLFGLFSAVGVVIGAAPQFLLLPSAMAVLVPKDFTPRRRRPTEAAARPSSRLGLLPGLGRWVVAHHRNVLCAGLAAMCVGAIGLPRTRTSSNSCASSLRPRPSFR